jgi:chromosome partition protein MukF
LISALQDAWRANFSLTITREDAALLAGVDAWLEASGDSLLDESQLRDIHRLLMRTQKNEEDTEEPLPDRSVSHALARLREQQLLVRIDPAGLVQSGEYTLTQLGRAVVAGFMVREGLTRETLEVIMSRIRVDLGSVRDAAQGGGDAIHWCRRVQDPLRITVTGLIELIHRRQRTMDLHQKRIREDISSLLKKNWLDAVSSCEVLLDDTARTLRDLHRALTREVERTTTMLQDIHELAYHAGETDALKALNHVRDQLDRVNDWGESRFRAWSEYYQKVHAFIRTVIQVDPDQALRARLRDAIHDYGDPVWGLLSVRQLPFRHFRELATYVDNAPVSRSIHDRLEMPEHDEREIKMIDRLESLLAQHIQDGERLNLKHLLERCSDQTSREELYALAGDLADWLLKQGQPTPRRELGWTPVASLIEIQDLTVT